MDSANSIGSKVQHSTHEPFKMHDGIPTPAIVILCIGGFMISCVCCLFVISCIRRKNVYDQTRGCEQTPVVVTTTTHTVPGGYTVATTYRTQTYSAPYPTQIPPVHMPMPMPMPASQPPAPGIHPNVAPYPTMPAVSINPPPYDVAVGGVGAGQPSNTVYEKQFA